MPAFDNWTNNEDKDSQADNIETLCTRCSQSLPNVLLCKLMKSLQRSLTVLRNHMFIAMGTEATVCMLYVKPNRGSKPTANLVSVDFKERGRPAHASLLSNKTWRWRHWEQSSMVERNQVWHKAQHILPQVHGYDDQVSVHVGCPARLHDCC